MHFDHLLQLFTSRDQLRPALCMPNEQDGFVYATDAHHIVRIPVALCQNQYPPHEKVPQFSSIWPGTERLYTSPIEISTDTLRGAIAQVPMVTYQETEECTECEGEGEIKCHCCGYSHTCKNCDGDGDVKTGKKVTEPDREYTIQFDGVHIAHRYISTLLQVAEATGDTIRLLTVLRSDRLVLFQTGEIQVGIMPKTHGVSGEPIRFPLQEIE